MTNARKGDLGLGVGEFIESATVSVAVLYLTLPHPAPPHPPHPPQSMMDASCLISAASRMCFMAFLFMVRFQVWE
jgi:hypothetical protein